MNDRLRDMPMSRIFSTGFKLFTAIGVFALTLALISGFSSCKPDWVGWHYPPVECTGGQGIIDSMLGAMTFGWKGGVGDHFVYVVLATLATVALFLAGFLLAFRDADPRSVAEAARTDVAPAVNPPSHVSYWPVLSAFAVTFMAIGLVANTASFVAGAVALGVCIVMWAVRTWAERVTGVEATNEEVREQVAIGLEVPIIALLVIGATAISLSRVFLTVDRLEAVAVAGVVAGLFFVAGVAFAYVPKIGKNVVAAVVVFAGLLLVGAGIVSTAVGEREFHHEEEEAHEGEGEGETDAPHTDAEEEEGTGD
jgi:hypothetical protein